MYFNLLAFLFTIGCCLLAIIFAGRTASNKEYKEWIESLNHPDNSFLFKIMNKLGVIVFSFLGFILYYLFTSSNIVPIIITVIIIQLMGLSPLCLHKTKNLKLFFVANFVLFILLPALIYFLLQTNLILAILVTIYLLWLVYEMSYFYRLIKLNK